VKSENLVNVGCVLIPASQLVGCWTIYSGIYAKRWLGIVVLVTGISADEVATAPSLRAEDDVNVTAAGHG
jgi:hypothetical protein